MKAAIVVGCHTYDDDEISNLQFAHLDAIELSTLFGKVCGIAPENIFTLTSAMDAPTQPTRAQLLKVLSKGSRLPPNNKIDTLFFSFSGHGYHSKIENKDYLVLKDTHWGAIEDTALDYETVVRYLRRWGAQNTIILLDACRSYIETSKSAEARVTQLNVEALCPDGMVTFCSCSVGQHSFESNELQHGVFTASLLRGLSDAGRCTTIYELSEFLVRDVPSLGREHSKPHQDPRTRLEPLGVQNLVIVSAEKLAEWKRYIPVSAEIRVPLDESFVSPVVWGGMIGIDFGTSASLVSMLSRDTNEIILAQAPGGGALVPSIVHFEPTLAYRVGAEAKRLLRFDAGNVIFNFKRWLGIQAFASIYGQSISPDMAAVLVLSSLKKTAELFTRVTVSRVLASCPVNFSAAQMIALEKAFYLAGFKEVRFMSEPCAAGLMVYQTQFANSDSLLLLVVDLGAGTLDLAGIGIALEKSPPKTLILEVVATDGDQCVGGLDYDEELAKLILENVEARYSALSRLIPREILALEAERIKILLSENEVVPVHLGQYEGQDGNLVDIQVTITRDSAARAFQELDRRVVAVIERLKDRIRDNSYWGDRNIDALVLSGQGTKVFSLERRLRTDFSELVIIDQFQENAVAKGLGHYLKVLRNLYSDRPFPHDDETGLLLIGATGRNYGVVCMSALEVSDHTGRKFEVTISRCREENQSVVYLLPRDYAVPGEATARCTFLPGEHAARIEIVEWFEDDEGMRAIGALAIAEGVELTAPVELKIDADVAEALTFEVQLNGTKENFRVGGSENGNMNTIKPPECTEDKGSLILAEGLIRRHHVSNK